MTMRVFCAISLMMRSSFWLSLDPLENDSVELMRLVMFCPSVVVFCLSYRKTVLVFSWTIPPHLNFSARVHVRFEAFGFFFVGPVVRPLLLLPLEWQDLSSDAREYPPAHEH